MGTYQIPVQTPELFGTPDGLTNTHVRKQIQRLRLSKGWTKHDLEQAAHLAPGSLEDFEAGIRRINVDTLRKIIEALQSDITEVWPFPEGSDMVRTSFPPAEDADSLHFSRLAEIHSLTGAGASCMFMSDGFPDHAEGSCEVAIRSPLRTLAAINLKPEDKDWLRVKVLHWTTSNPWTAYRHSENGRSLYVCLKDAHVEIWAEGLIQRCLGAWLASTPL